MKKPMTQQANSLAANTNIVTHTDGSQGYFDNFGQWQGEPLERPEQLPLEERLQVSPYLEKK